MVRLALLIWFWFCVSVGAQSISLIWDASPGTNVAGYRLYSSTNDIIYSSRTNAIITDTGTNCTVSLKDLQPGKWRFVVTAYSHENLESDFSNMLICEIPIEKPGNLRTLVLQYSYALTNGWQDAVFFKIKPGPP